MNQDFPQPICEQIWNRKYRLITPNPDIKDDNSVSDTWDRIARACADAPLTIGLTGVVQGITLDMQKDRETVFRSILAEFSFLPGGRIIAGAGSGRNVTLFNCYAMGLVPDDMSGIFESLREAALTMQQGGGIGYDFSPLRPMGSPVRGVDADASGPLSFMDVWDSMCRTIMSAGYRRGAMMATLRVDHPDIEAFIRAKHDKTKLRMFNMSVLCSDAFMRAVEANETWDLIHISKPPQGVPNEVFGQDTQGRTLYLHKTISARNLWELIMQSTYNYAEPGVLFIDVINQMNNLWYEEEITTTNPCGEQPLPPYGACLLGSINLTQMVKDPFGNSKVLWNKLTYTAKAAVRMLDSVIDMSNFPIPQQKAEALFKRRMGIGITGLADMLFMLGETYGSKEAADIANQVMQTITIACYEESILLAELYGPCPATASYDSRMAFIQSGFLEVMPEYIRDGIVEHGIRNSHLTSIAPTGTISMYAGNISSGIEPIFAQEYTRKILDDDGVTTKEEVVQDYAVHLLGTLLQPGKPISEIMDSLVTAQTLTPADHLRMLEAVQPWIDSSISKTINCSKDISFDNFQEIYLEAYDMGLKGCTTYRPNDVTGSVLSLESDDEPEAMVVTPKGETLLLQHPITEPMKRPNNLTGTTYRLKWDTKSFYVTINDYLGNDGKVIPFEVFINSSEMTSLQWTVALTRMISAIYRRGGDVAFVGEELKRISDPSGGYWVDKKYVPSFVALLGQTIVNHLQGIKDNEMLAQIMDPELSDRLLEEGDYTEQCPECSNYTMVVSGGCNTCTNCGHSKCG